MMINKEVIQLIKQTVSETFEVSIENMEAQSRVKEFCRARHCAMVLMRELTPLPLKAIGAQFGRRDHSTVIHATSAVSDMEYCDKIFKKVFNDLKENLRLRIKELEEMDLMPDKTVTIEKRFKQSGYAFI